MELRNKLFKMLKKDSSQYLKTLKTPKKITPKLKRKNMILQRLRQKKPRQKKYEASSFTKAKTTSKTNQLKMSPKLTLSM